MKFIFSEIIIFVRRSDENKQAAINFVTDYPIFSFKIQNLRGQTSNKIILHAKEYGRSFQSPNTVIRF